MIEELMRWFLTGSVTPLQAGIFGVGTAISVFILDGAVFRIIFVPKIRAFARADTLKRLGLDTADGDDQFKSYY